MISRFETRVFPADHEASYVTAIKKREKMQINPEILSFLLMIHIITAEVF